MASPEESSEQNYSKWSTNRLQERLEQIDSQFVDLRERFPRYPFLDVSAREYQEMQRLERDGSDIRTELYKRTAPDSAFEKQMEAGPRASTGLIPGEFAGLTAEEARLTLCRIPSAIPENPPTDLLRDLWPQINVILLKACKKFPFQTHTLEMCKHIFAELKPMVCAAIKAGKIKAHDVSPAMRHLLNSLLASNSLGNADDLRQEACPRR
jgi:hypothetical protein